MALPAPFHPNARLAPIDLAVVAIYLIAITIFGLTFGRRGGKNKSTSNSLQSYFLADNTIPWWAIALSIVSAETSTLTIISVPGVAFAGDLGFLQIVLGYMLGRIVVAWLFLPKYFRGQMLTAYQLIDQRFGPVLHKVTAGLFLCTRAAAEGVRVFAISIVVSIAIGTGDTLSIAIITALTLLYTFEGGMAAVIWTDVVQMALYVAGTLIAVWTLGTHVPGGWYQIYAVAAPLGKFHMLNFALNLTSTYTFWAGVLGGTFLTMASHGTDQLMVQRMLAARNLRESRLALLSSGVVIFIQFTLFLLIGVGLFVFYGAAGAAGAPHLASEMWAHTISPDRLFPTFIVQQMPHGIAGLLIAAILAAAMSNLSAALNSLSSTTVVDFWLPLTRRGSGNTRFISRASTVLWALILFAIAVYSIQAGGKGHVVETGLSIASVAYGCLLGVFLLGTLTRYATQWGTIGGMILGFALNLWLWQGTFPLRIGAMTIPHIAFTWYVLIGALVTFTSGLLFSAISRLRRPALVSALLLMMVSSFAAGAGPAFSQAIPTEGVPHPPGARVGDQAPDFTPISTLIDAAIAAHKLPGAVVLIGHDGHIVFEQAYGLRKLAGEPGPDGKAAPAEPMTEDTLFDMASLTKVLLTSTAVLQLYEASKLSLDDPVAMYLPAFAQNGKGAITIRQLLTHYSGLPEDISLKDDWGLAKPDKAEGIRRAMAAVPYGPPGETFKYSDINFITLGVLVERLSGQPLSHYAEQHIFVPLGMHDTHYHPFNSVCGGQYSTLGAAILYTGSPAVQGKQDKEDTPEIECYSLASPDSWNPGVIPSTAPTAHDNEGTAATNPDFDHLLRGTVHDPTTRRMGGVAGHAGVFSTAADLAIFCQAYLDKLLNNSGHFPLSQATLQMATSPQAPTTAVKTATIFTPAGEPTTGVAQRGLGWDINSAFSRPRGAIFPIATAGHPGSFGHTGFTGTSIWMDPTSDTYVILLANAIHPRGAPPISPLRSQVATAVASALSSRSAAQGPALPTISARDINRLSTTGGPSDSTFRYCQPPVICDSFGAPTPTGAPHLAPAMWASTAPPTQTGIDVLESTGFAALQPYHRIAVLTNQSGIDSRSARTIDILAKATTLVEIFTPEHGLFARQDTEHLTTETDPTTKVPVISLYGPRPSDKHPKQSDLKKVDAVVIDLPDAGVRFWTYETVLGYFLEDCAKAKIPVIVLDRPNPIGGGPAQGPLSDPGAESYIDFTPLPVRHGMTMGELARYFNRYASLSAFNASPSDPEAVQAGNGAGASASGSNIVPPALEPGLHAQLTVVPLENWHRDEYFADTGLPWVPPSPNMKTPATNVVYPGVALIETTNMSVGRGSPAPYENFGAPFLKPDELAAYLTARHIPGVTFTSTTLTIAETPERYPFHGQTIPGIHITVSDRSALDSPEMGIELLSALHHLYPAEFQLEKAHTILRNAQVLAEIKSGKDPRDIAAGWSSALAAFNTARQSALLYP